MPYSTIGDRRISGFDKLLELRDYSAAALSATGAETGILVYPTELVVSRVVINVAAYTSYSAGTVYWTINLEASATLGSGYVAIGSVIPTGVAGRFEIGFTGNQVAALASGALYLRANAVKTSTAGNLTYGMFIAPVDC